MIGTPDLPPFFTHIPVMILASTRGLLSVHECAEVHPPRAFSVLYWASFEARSGKASGQCLISLRAGDGTVLVIPENSAPHGESHPPWYCCNVLATPPRWPPACVWLYWKASSPVGRAGPLRSLDVFLIRAPVPLGYGLPPSCPSHLWWPPLPVSF